MSQVTLFHGDVRDLLPIMPAESVHCIVTSPPYWGLRNYGVTGQLGLEKSPEAYLEAMVGVFRELRRVLRKDGTLWVNMGDSYTDSGRGADTGSTLQGSRRNQRESRRAQDSGRRATKLAPKNLLMMPARLALALQADKWWLRSDIVWSKPNPMPESVTDRPTRSHEYVYLFSRSERYVYDATAIAEPASEATHARVSQATLGQQQGGSKTEQYAEGFPGKKQRDRKPVEIVQAMARKYDDAGRLADHKGQRRRPPDGVNPKALSGNGGKQNESFSAAVVGPVIERNARSVWEISTQPYPGAHFATFPEELARRCIVAGSSPRTCEVCGAPWRRVVEALGGTIGRAWHDHVDDAAVGQRAERRAKGRDGAYRRLDRGFRAGCACEQQGTGRSVVLDPFGGSGTVAQVASGNGRDSIYIDLNADYLELARQRIGPLLCVP